jgi:hypothetical protein
VVHSEGSVVVQSEGSVSIKVGELLQERSDSHLLKAILQHAAGSQSVPTYQRGAPQTAVTLDFNDFI